MRFLLLRIAELENLSENLWVRIKFFSKLLKIFFRQNPLLNNIGNVFIIVTV